MEETHCFSNTTIRQERRSQREQELTTKYVFQTIAPEYVTKAVPGWTLTISGGPTLVEQTGQTGSRVFLSGKLGLATDYDRRTHVEMGVSRQASSLVLWNEFLDDQ